MLVKYAGTLQRMMDEGKLAPAREVVKPVFIPQDHYTGTSWNNRKAAMHQRTTHTNKKYRR